MDFRFPLKSHFIIFKLGILVYGYVLRNVGARGIGHLVAVSLPTHVLKAGSSAKVDGLSAEPCLQLSPTISVSLLCLLSLPFHSKCVLGSTNPEVFSLFLFVYS